ncbi:MAG: CDP-diacylglycerol--glycerol-3-phosphate 3-phosphatidyltransferase [Actinomycetota bacterium]
MGASVIRERGVVPLGIGWPNIVTFGRILLVPVVVILVLAQTERASYAATAVFVAGGLSDFLDGYLARRFGPATLTGAWLDPLSDKLLVAAAVISLAAVSRFPVWAAAVIVVREAAVSVLRAYMGTRRASMPASDIAKLKTVVQLTAIGLYMLPLSHAMHGVKLVVLSVAVAVTVYSGLDYFLHVSGRVRTR